MDTLSSLRRLKRYVDSQNRKQLKKRMSEYDVLARAGRGGFEEQNIQSPDTIHDISQHLAEQISVRNTRNRFVRRTTQVDRITSHVVCDEVRRTWQSKLYANQVLSDDTRQKLHDMSRTSSIFSLRESKLNDLAKWMVFQWTDAEGYDPAKHVRKIEDVYISPVIF